MCKSTTAFFINKDMQHLFNFKTFNEAMVGNDENNYYVILTAIRLFDFLKEENIKITNFDSDKLNNANDKLGLYDDEDVTEKINEWFEEYGSNLGTESLVELKTQLEEIGLNLMDLKDQMAEITDEGVDSIEQVESEITERLKEGYEYYVYCNLSGYHAVILMKQKFIEEAKTIESVKQILHEF